MTWRRTAWGVGVTLVLIAGCGSSSDDGLFGGGSGSGGGGTSGSGATGGATGGSGGDTGGSGGDTGGSGGAGGATGGAGGSGGDTGGAGGATGGVGGDTGGAGGATGGVGGDTGGTGGATGGTGGNTGGTGGTGGSAGYCFGKCGSPSSVQPLGCHCDEACVGQNDCCPDYGPACNPADGKGQITCGNTSCSTSGSFCCQQFQGTGLPYNPVCQNQGTSCQGPDVFCDGPEDCGSGQVCCSQQGAGAFISVMECRSPTDCDNSSQRIICGNDPSVCDPGQVCIPHPWVPNYNFCSGQ